MCGDSVSDVVQIFGMLGDICTFFDILGFVRVVRCEESLHMICGGSVTDVVQIFGMLGNFYTFVNILGFVRVVRGGG